MRNQQLYQRISYAYLSLVPLVTAILGFTVHRVPYKVYLPLWIVNVFLMMLASRMLGANRSTTDNKDKQYNATSGFLLIAPWFLFSIFAGMGSPPGNYAEWVSTAFEQQVRYSFLIIGGILLLAGFIFLRESLKSTNGNGFALAGLTAIAIAMPLFILNMCYWHSFLPETFALAESSPVKKLPDWYQPVRKLFLVDSIVEVSLTYLATAAFTAALKTVAWFRKNSSTIYIVISLMAFAFVSLYGFYPKAVVANGFPFYPFMIPAIPFAIPYYVGINLLRKSGN